MHYALCIMNYLLSLHQSCGWQRVALPAGDIFRKRFSFILIRKFAKILFRRINSEIALSCRISTPRQGVRDISIRRGSGLFISERAFGDAFE